MEEWESPKEMHLTPMVTLETQNLDSSIELEEDLSTVIAQSGEKVVDTNSPSPSTEFTKNVHYVVGLKEREEIAKAAFKTWFKIKPGNKEIKDKWWALYYRKVIPKYFLRDNHLGRQINAWIAEELQLLNHSTNTSKETETTESKKRKVNSSKEGTLPAYLNVELVHPSQELIKSSKRSAECTGIHITFNFT